MSILLDSHMQPAMCRSRCSRHTHPDYEHRLQEAACAYDVDPKDMYLVYSHRRKCSLLAQGCFARQTT